MSDILAYNSAMNYARYQSLRPDYTSAISQTMQVAKKYSEGNKHISLADFCAGTGTNTKRFAQEMSKIERATLIDINPHFLATALTSNINANVLDVRRQDILTAKLPQEYDIVFSIFAYHHVPDKDKLQYLSLARDCLKPNGTIILTEIYLDSLELCQTYYSALLSAIARKQQTAGLKRFLQETANSTTFEFKVAKEFADAQIKQLDLAIVDEKKIWPTNSNEKGLAHDAGTFVQVLKKN